MKSTTNITLNLQLPNYSVAVYAVQGDTMSREIEAALFDGVSPFVPEYGTLSVVRYKKPDGTCGFYDTDEDGNDAVTWEDNVATIRLAEQALTVAGTVLCQVQFYNGNEQRLSSFTWKIIVEENVCPDETITSSDYFNILTQQIASIMEVITDLPVPSTVLPEMDGAAAIGVRGEFARADHVHPSDTSKADVSAVLNKVLYFTNVACSAITGDFVSISNESITSDHVLAECVFANPPVIMSTVTWTTANGSLTLNGTCSTATTCNIVLIKKDN